MNKPICNNCFGLKCKCLSGTSKLVPGRFYFEAIDSYKIRLCTNYYLSLTASNPRNFISTCSSCFKKCTLCNGTGVVDWIDGFFRGDYYDSLYFDNIRDILETDKTIRLFINSGYIERKINERIILDIFDKYKNQNE